MNKKAKILVVCHDAGGAEIVSAFIARYQTKYQFFCLAKGPAGKIFKQKKLQSLLIKKTNGKDPEKILASLPPISRILTGTSWTTSLELDFIKIAKKKKIKTIAYLDHWVHYKERFGWPHAGWKENLPSDLWVGDKSALDLAKKIFPKSVSVTLIPNQFFKTLQIKYKKIKSKKIKSPSGILLATEPITLPMNYLGDKRKFAWTELQIIDEILKLLVNKKFSKPVFVRVHPAEKKDKYDTVIKKYQGALAVKKSTESDMFQDLARVKTVIGMESMFLVVAALCGKTTISFLPDHNRVCPLPFSAIKKTRKITDVAKYLT